MIRLLDGLPAGVFGFEAVGRVTADDYRDVLSPALGAALEGGHARVLCLLGARYEGYSPAAMWQDTRLGLGHLRGWERVALVTDHHGLAEAAHAFSWLMPGEARVFATADLPAATAWLAEH